MKNNLKKRDIRRMDSIIRQFSKLGKHERGWVVARLVSDHRKAS